MRQAAFTLLFSLDDNWSMATSPQFRQKNSNFWPFRNMEFFDPLGGKKKKLE